ncbi:MAG: hypothetical protein N3B10_12385 [Armatimonadetes bacterium]|nr:hypothetical protein [Armatimonadota bacterium]
MWKPTVDEIERLYEKHAKQLEATHWGKFLALTPDGQFILGEDDVEIFFKAMQQFGEGNFVLIRIGERSVDVLRQVSQSARSDIYPFVEVAWSARHFRQQNWAYADTGFEGFLSIPSTLIQRIGEPHGNVWTRMADGSVSISMAYFGTVEIVGIGEAIPSRILAMGGEFLLGRRILDRYRVTFDRGRQIIVERI